MAVRWSNEPFTVGPPRLLQERGTSLRALASQIGVSNSHLSRVVRRADYKTASPELMQRIAEQLELPADYFPEVREAFVIERVKRDPALRDSLYKRLHRSG
jgi:transcriptional regulator with XRE-family HTH domain